MEEFGGGGEAVSSGTWASEGTGEMSAVVEVVCWFPGAANVIGTKGTLARGLTRVPLALGYGVRLDLSPGSTHRKETEGERLTDQLRDLSMLLRDFFFSTMTMAARKTSRTVMTMPAMAPGERAGAAVMLVVAAPVMLPLVVVLVAGADVEMEVVVAEVSGVLETEVVREVLEVVVVSVDMPRGVSVGVLDNEEENGVVMSVRESVVGTLRRVEVGGRGPVICRVNVNGAVKYSSSAFPWPPGHGEGLKRFPWRTRAGG